MREEALKILLDLVRKASEGIDTAVSFSQAQIPDVIQQLLLWNVIYSLIMNAIAIVLIGGYAWLTWKGAKKGIECCIPLTPQQLEYNRNETWDHKKHKREEWIEGAGFMRNGKNNIEGGEVFGIVIAGIIVAIASAFLINADWLKIWVAPKLYLIEYAASIMK